MPEYFVYFRLLETADEYFDPIRKYHGIWKLYGLDLPDEAFDHGEAAPKSSGKLMPRVWWIAAVVLLLVSIWYIVIRLQ